MVVVMGLRMWRLSDCLAPAVDAYQERNGGGDIAPGQTTHNAPASKPKSTAEVLAAMETPAPPPSAAEPVPVPFVAGKLTLPGAAPTLQARKTAHPLQHTTAAHRRKCSRGKRFASSSALKLTSNLT